MFEEVWKNYLFCHREGARGHDDVCKGESDEVCSPKRDLNSSLEATLAGVPEQHT